MPKRQAPIEETLSYELYNHFLEFIGTRGVVPLERAFWGWLIGKGKKYTAEQLPEHIFRWAFERLIREHWIEVEPDTRSLKVVDPDDVKITVKGYTQNR